MTRRALYYQFDNKEAPGPGTATIELDRCFKGWLEGSVTVAADEYFPGGGWGGGGGIFAPEIDEYLLLFLRKNKGEVYELADWRGALPVSTQTSSKPRSQDPLINLENDFKAGLNDHEPEIVLKSICWLGRLRHLQSTTELHALLDTADPLERAYLWEALLLVGDVSVLLTSKMVLVRKHFP